MTRTNSSAAIVLAALTVITLLAGCAANHNPRVPEASQLVMGGIVLSDAEIGRLEDGRRLFMNECARCHGRIWPDELGPDEWKKVLKRHRGRTPVDDEKFGNLAEYVLRVSYCFETRKCSSLPVKSH